MFTIAEARCPSGHLIIQAVHREGRESALVYIQTEISQMIQKRILLPFCAVCAATAPRWKYEARLMPFRDVTHTLAAFRNQRTESQMAELVSANGWATPLTATRN